MSGRFNIEAPYLDEATGYERGLVRTLTGKIADLQIQMTYLRKDRETITNRVYARWTARRIKQAKCSADPQSTVEPVASKT